MKVILRADITNVGRQGDIKDVSDGYARNYLIPRNLVMEATDANLKLWSREKVKLEKLREEQIAAARELAEKIEKASFNITVKVGEAGKLFGSVTNAGIAKLLGENGFNVEKHAILLPEAIKETGVYTVGIRLHPEVVAKAKVWIVGEKSEEQAEIPEQGTEEAPAAEGTEEKE